jgi:dihydropyrimidinase
VSREKLDLALRGGTVVQPDGRRKTDLGIRGERIAGIGEVGEAETTIDASGKLLLPGTIDVHTHLRLPGEEDPDRFYHDTTAAVMGGTTTVLSFVEQPRGSSPLETLRLWQREVETEAASDYGFHLILTDLGSRAETEIPEIIETGCPTFKAFMVYEELMISDRDLYRALGITSDAGGMMMVHCENEVMLSALVSGHLDRGLTAPRYHAPSRPPLVEAEATHRALCMARMAKAPLYIVHMSCGDALEHLRRARRSGQPAYAETCPHYLTLSEDRYQGADQEAARYVISPPLRAASHGGILWGALADGDLDVIGSDHVPRRLEDERQAVLADFSQIPNGAPGIETLSSLVYSEGVARDRISLERMAELLSASPAKLFGLEQKGSLEVGKDADIVIWNPEASRTLSQSDLHHSADFTPYEGMEVKGAVETTLVRGKVVADRGRFVGRRGEGRFVRRRLASGEDPS